MDRGAWRSTGHRVAKNWTQLSNTHTHKYMQGVGHNSHTYTQKVRQEQQKGGLLKRMQADL